MVMVSLLEIVCKSLTQMIINFTEKHPKSQLQVDSLCLNAHYTRFKV